MMAERWRSLVRQLYELHGSQKEVAKALGSTQPQVGRWLSAKRPAPPLADAEAMLRKLRLDPAFLTVPGEAEIDYRRFMLRAAAVRESEASYRAAPAGALARRAVHRSSPSK